MEFLIKNGATRIIQDLKDDIFKIRTLQEWTYHEDGIDKWRGVREKAKAIWDLIADPERLEEEREFSKKNREKFKAFSGEEGSSYYKGINEDDIFRNKSDSWKKSELGSKKEDKKKHESGKKHKNKKRKKSKSESSSKSDSSKSSSSERSSSREKKKSKNKKNKGKDKDKNDENDKSKSKNKKNSEEVSKNNPDDLFDIFGTDNSSNQKQSNINVFDTNSLFNALPQSFSGPNVAAQQQMKSIPKPPQSSNVGFTSKTQSNDFDIFGTQSSAPQPQSIPSYGQTFGVPQSSGFPSQSFGSGMAYGNQSQFTPSPFQSYQASFQSQQVPFQSQQDPFQSQQPPSSGMFVSPPSTDIFGAQPTTVPKYTPQVPFTSQGMGVQKPLQTTVTASKPVDEGFTAFQSSQPETFSGIGGLVNLSSLKKKEEPPKVEKKANLFSSQTTPAPSYATSWGVPAPSTGFGGIGVNMYAPQADVFSSAGMYAAPQPAFGFTQPSQPTSQPPMGGFTSFAPPSQNKSSSSGFGYNSKGGNSLFD